MMRFEWIVIAAGILAMIFRARFARLIHAQQERAWGLRLPPGTLRWTEGVIVVTGIGIVFLGVLTIVTS